MGGIRCTDGGRSIVMAVTPPDDWQSRSHRPLAGTEILAKHHVEIAVSVDVYQGAGVRPVPGFTKIGDGWEMATPVPKESRRRTRV